jgi:hypothetical protein
MLKTAFLFVETASLIALRLADREDRVHTSQTAKTLSYKFSRATEKGIMKAVKGRLTAL